MKRIFCLLLMIFISLSIFGCEKKSTTLTISADSEIIDTDYFKKALTLFRYGNDYEVSVKEFSKKDLTDPSVDIIIHPLDNIMIENGFEDFYDMSFEPWVNEIEGYCIKSVIHDNHIYGLPLGTSSITGCFYNKNIFQAFNLTVPTNQNEFDTLCDTLVQSGVIPMYVAGNDLSPVRYDLVFENTFSRNTQIIDKLNSEELKVIEIPGISSMMDWWKTGSERSWFGADWYNAKLDDAAFHLGDGYAAMIICDDTWLSENLNGYIYNSSDFGLMPIFMGTDSPFAVCSQPHMVSVKKESAEKTIALDFVRMLAEKEKYNTYYDGVHTIRMFKHQNTIRQPVQFPSFNTEYISSISELCGRLENFDQSVGATAIMQYTRGEIGLEVALNELANNKK